jgi:hypothetical protein
MILRRSLAHDRDLVAARLQADAEGVFDGAEVFVGDPEELGQPGFGQGYGVVLVRDRFFSLWEETLPRPGPGRARRLPIVTTTNLVAMS